MAQKKVSNEIKSPITGKPSQLAFTKMGVQYYRDDLGNLFSKPLDQSNMVGGTGEELRIPQNAERIARVKTLVNIPNPVVLDYGCGNGILKKQLNENGCIAIGYDKFIDSDPIPTDGRCHVATLIEVVEHLTAPFSELTAVKKALATGGTVMIETSFSDWLNPEDNYINPEIGHCTIFSHAGLDYLMSKKGFKAGNHINRNVRIYEKE